MAPDLTDSVYAMLVLAYATLTVTNYIFSSLEKRAKATIDAINVLRNGVCAFIWDQQRQNIQIPNDGELPLHEKLVRRFDLVNSARNMKVERWMWLQGLLFLSVTLASVLLLPVLLLKLEMYRWMEATVQDFTIVEQILASGAVVLVALNLVKNAHKLWRMESLKEDLQKVAAGVRPIPAA